MTPALSLFLSSMSAFPGVLSDHATYALLPATAIDGLPEPPTVLLRLIILPNVAPPSTLLL